MARRRGKSKTARTEPIDDVDLQSVLKTAVDDAVLYIDTMQAPDRQKATNYYQGQPFGNEEQGRSQIVMTEVRDVVLAMMPSLMRVFVGQEDVATFSPQTPDDIAFADLATDYVDYIIHRDNPGYLLLQNAFKDALVRRLGVLKWWVDEATRVTEEAYDALSPVQVAMLADDDTVEVLEVDEIVTPAAGSDDPEEDPETDVDYDDEDDEYQQPGKMDADGEDADGQTQIVGPEGPEEGQSVFDPQRMYACRIRRTVVEKRIRIMAVPPEELLISREARSEDDALLVSHRRLVRSSELVAMGYPQELVDTLPGDDAGFEFNREAQARNPGLWQPNQDFGHEPLKTHLYYESYLRYDGDDDGVVELRRVCSIGNSHVILSDEIVPDVPFAFFTMDPEPHTIFGQSVTDHVGDLQVIKSAIVRGTLDSLAQSIHPRTVIVEGQVNIDDVMNVETGAIIRARSQDSIRELNTTFVGQQAMPMLGYLDEVRASRTGISRATQGLDADVLQSTTKEAVMATTSAAEQRLEYVARCFAETGMRRLMRGLLRTIVRVQNRPRAVVLRGRDEFTEIDPRAWNADMHVIVHVGKGLGKPEERIALLTQVLGIQKEAIATLGPDNPLCTLAQYRDTLVRVMAIAGERDGDRYFKRITPQDCTALQQKMDQQKQAAAAAQGANGSQPNPQQLQIEQVKAQTEMSVAQQRAQVEAARLQMERQKLALDARDKAAQADLKQQELNIKRQELGIRQREVVAKAATLPPVTGGVP